MKRVVLLTIVLLFVFGPIATAKAVAPSYLLTDVERRISRLNYEVADAWNSKGNWVWEEKGNAYGAYLRECYGCIATHNHPYWVGYAPLDYPDLLTADMGEYLEIRAVQGLPRGKMLHSVLHRNGRGWNLSDEDYKMVMISVTRKYHVAIDHFTYWSAGDWRDLLVPDRASSKAVFNKVMNDVWTELCQKWNCTYSQWID